MGRGSSKVAGGTATGGVSTQPTRTVQDLYGYLNAFIPETRDRLNEEFNVNLTDSQTGAITRIMRDIYTDRRYVDYNGNPYELENFNIRYVAEGISSEVFVEFTLAPNIESNRDLVRTMDRRRIGYTVGARGGTRQLYGN